MARRDHDIERRDASREMGDALRSEPFRLGGVNRLVKVVPLSEGVPPLVSGYVTQERFITGMMPLEIERALGLNDGKLASGCRVLALQRQPGPSEIVYELTTKYPGGEAHTRLSGLGAPPDQQYPPSDKAFIHQWRLTTWVPATLVCTLAPTARYTSPSRP